MHVLCADCCEKPSKGTAPAFARVIEIGAFSIVRNVDDDDDFRPVGL